MYRDAVKQLCDRIILISNDSDAMPALKAIREDFPHIIIGVIMPIHPPIPHKTMRRASGSLSKYADWTIAYITDQQLLSAQVPPAITTNKQPIVKPNHW